ncbi:MAG: hypothetical protein V1746_07250 [bacterium]
MLQISYAMQKAVLSLGFLGLLIFAPLAVQGEGFHSSIEMAEAPLVKQNRFYPRWTSSQSISKVYYNKSVVFHRPVEEEVKQWKPMIKAFLKDLFEQKEGGEAQIYSPKMLIHPAILNDGRAYYQLFWKDKTNRVRYVTNDVEILKIGSRKKWTELWVRFVERGKALNHTNYVALLVETPAMANPYLADFKALGRTPTTPQNERAVEKVIPLKLR